MTILEVPEARRADAGLLAAMLGRMPVPSDGRIELLSRQEVAERAKELRSRGEGARAEELLSVLDFDGDSTFRKTFSQVASRSVRVRTSTLYGLLDWAGAGESGSEALCRALAPVIERQLDGISDQLDGDKREMLRYSLRQWAGARRAGPEEARPPGFRAGGGRAPEDVRKYSRYFFKNLFRLNNIHDGNEFFHPPEVIEDYWEVIAPDQGIFSAELCPAAGSFVLSLFDHSRCFGLERTDNPDYFGLVEMLALEARMGRVKGCAVTVRGATAEDDLALQELLGIETHLLDEGPLPFSHGLPEELSPAGLAAFREGLRELDGIRAEVLFPVSERSGGTNEDFAALVFDIELDERRERFTLDGAEASEADLDHLAAAIGAKLLALSRRLHRSPLSFPRPDVEERERQVHGMMEQAEKKGLDEALAREIVAQITVLDYYESLEEYSYALARGAVACLEEDLEVAFTIPRALLALLDLTLEGRTFDDVLRGGAEGRG